MRDRQRRAAAHRIAYERAKLQTAGLVSLGTKKPMKRVTATAEQLAFRDYCNQGYDADQARAMIREDKA